MGRCGKCEFGACGGKEEVAGMGLIARAAGLVVLRNATHPPRRPTPRPPPHALHPLLSSHIPLVLRRRRRLRRHVGCQPRLQLVHQRHLGEGG